MKYFFVQLLAASVKVCNDPNEKNCVSVPTVSGGDLLTNGLNIVYFILGTISVIMMIIAGYQYLTANGDPQKAQRGMHTVIYCAIGLVVAISAFAITNFVAGGVTK